MIVEDKTESDHLPICVYLQLEYEFKAAEDSFQHNTQMQQIWTEENIKKVRELLEDSESQLHQSDLEKAWNKLKQTIKKAT